MEGTLSVIDALARDNRYWAIFRAATGPVGEVILWMLEEETEQGSVEKSTSINDGTELEHQGSKSNLRNHAKGERSSRSRSNERKRSW